MANLKKIILKTYKYPLAILTLGLAILASCKKEDPQPTPAAPATGSVEVNLAHHWVTENDNFSLNNAYIHPTTEDTMIFTTLKYYISNFRLKKSDGTWWSHPESYFLVNLSSPTSAKLDLTGVPPGQYTEMEYTFGVDSLRNVSGAQTGALSVSNNMFWSWNSGYIMLKAEGISDNSSTGSFAFHLGGFTGANNVVSTHNAVFNITLNVTASHKSEIHLLVYADKLWQTSAGLETANAIHMPGAGAKTMADDFANGIAFSHIHN